MDFQTFAAVDTRVI